MKRMGLVALSILTVATTMALAMDDASAAARRGGVNRGGVHAGGINRAGGVNRVGVNRVGINRVGVNRPGIVNRPGLVAASSAGWNDNWNNWNRPGLGLAATGLAIGATRAAVYNSGNYYDSEYYPTRARYLSDYRYGIYFGPVCNPWVDRLCQ
jgi:hypothetical protein